MDAEQLLSDALTLMLLGMGTVFTFLTILVFVTIFMSAVVNRIAPARAAPLSPQASSGPGTDPNLLAAIAAAIHAHRSRH